MTSTVQWGPEEYVASHHARDALAEMKRSGAPATHTDGPELGAAAADRLFGLRYSTWGFGDSIAFEALIAATERLGDERWRRFAHGWSRAWASRSQPFVRLDCTAPGAAMVSLARRYEDTQLLDTLTSLAGFLAGRPMLHGAYQTWSSSPLLAPYSGASLSSRDRRLLSSPPAGVFVDCLHFDPPFFASLGVVVSDERLVDLAIGQALAYVDALQGDDGLFGHFVLDGDSRVFGHGWGRGQGWALLGMLEVVRETAAVARPHDVARLRESIRHALRAMLALQRDDGAWFAVVDRDDSGDESSTAAFMAVAFRRAAAAGIGDADRLVAAADRARAAVLASIDEDACLTGVSAAVYASTEISHYGRVPRGYVVPWGQGPAVLALLGEESA